MTDPKPQTLADYLASPAGADDLAELQTAMEESEQPGLITRTPDDYLANLKWRLNKREQRDYWCSIWYHGRAFRYLREERGKGETAQEAIDDAVNRIRAWEKAAASHEMTPAERAAQRESFAFGNAKASNPEVTREMVREAIKKEDESK